MDATMRASIITAGGVVLAAFIAWWGSRRIPRAQRESLEVQTAERVVRMQEKERLSLAKRITELEAEVRSLRAQSTERERDLEHARGEATALRAEIGTLRATLATKEAELAALKAQQTSTATINVNTSPASTEGQS